MAFAVVFAANVLYPISLTDFFLTLAGYGLYRPHWSTEILREVERNLLEKDPQLTADNLSSRTCRERLFVSDESALADRGLRRVLGPSAAEGGLH